MNFVKKNKKIFFLFFSFNYLLLFATNISKSFEFQKLTILTQPIGHSGGYDGHHAVNRSLFAGLKQLGINYNHNPRHVEDIGDVVHVLCNIDALKQAMQLRKHGRIKRLIAGPQLMVRSNEYNHILASPEIDMYLVNSEWTKNAYIEDEPSLKERIFIWYSGVDAAAWAPQDLRDVKLGNNVIVYWKTEAEDFCCQVEDVLKQNNWNPIRIRYGSYTQTQYKNLLHNCAFCVFLSRSESQGIALAESWSMNVPTLVWDPQAPSTINGKVYWPISAAPYLNSCLGLQWKNIEEFEALLKDMPEKLSLFSPRNWVSQNMTDEISVQLLCSIITRNISNA